MKVDFQKIFFNLAFTIIIFFIGFGIAFKQLFPYEYIDAAHSGLYHLFNGNSRNHLCTINPRLDTSGAFYISNSNSNSNDQLFLVSYVDEELINHIKLIEANGDLINKWELSNTITNHIIDHDNFEKKSITRIHTSGIKLTRSGDLILEVVNHGIFCLDWNNEVKWSKELNSHHSLFVDKNNTIWTCVYGPNEFDYDGSFFEDNVKDDYIVNIDSNGNILKKWSISDLLLKNKYDGLVSLNYRIEDRYHLNDVEVYDLPSEGYFKKGDVMVSLRNLNTVFVFDQTNDSIKWMCTGMFHHQHDPDFIDSNNIILFDNKYVNYKDQKIYSRILKVNAITKKSDVLFGGIEHQAFFTETLGKQEITKNGNILLTSSHEGRVLKVAPNGEVLWILTNYIEDQSMKTVVIESSVIEKDYLNKGLID
ncbi:MAG: aryl-sulfate sulfotransferase [Bacteroidia bacterium]